MSLAAFLAILGHVATMWTVAIIVPGMDLLMVLRTAIVHGRIAAFKVTAGIASAIFIWGLAGFFGVHILFETSPLLYSALKIGGGLYLCYIGLQLLLQSFKKEHTSFLKDGDTLPIQNNFFRSGMLTNLSNPKAPIFTSSLFATSIPSHTPLYVGLICISIMVAISVIWFTFITLLLSQEKISFHFQRFRHWIDRISGGTLLVLGGHFAFSRR